MTSPPDPPPGAAGRGASSGVDLVWPELDEFARHEIVFEPWESRDVSAWESESNEPRGIREKQWVRDPEGVRWLRKGVRSSRAFEMSIEAVGLRLARALGLPAPESSVCEWNDGETRVRGIVVRSFADAIADGSAVLGATAPELQEGALLLAAQDRTYDPRAKAMRPQHTLLRIQEALRRLEQQHPGTRLVEPFLMLLCFDAWIGNSDRHAGNWGIVWRDRVPALAPIYDPAGCLGAELDERHRLLDPSRRPEELSSYVAKTRSGFGDGTKLIGQAGVIDALKMWPAWTTYVRACLARFWAALDTPLVKFLSDLPESWLPPSRRGLVLTLLVERLGWLKLKTLE